MNIKKLSVREKQIYLEGMREQTKTIQSVLKNGNYNSKSEVDDYFNQQISFFNELELKLLKQNNKK